MREEVVGYLPKAALDFEALIKEPLSSADYASFGFPVLVMQGAASPFPTRLIASHLVSRIAAAVGKTLVDAGHMGPVTHADAVAASFARNIRTAGEAAAIRLLRNG